MSLRLGLVHENLARTGGAENVVLWTARGLAARGHAVRVISTALPGQLPPGVEGVRLSLEGSLRRTATHRRAAAALAPHLAGLDVLNVTNFPASAWAHLALRERPGPPLTLTYHEPPRHLYEPVMDAEYLASPLNVSRRPLTVWFDHWALGALRRLDREAVRAAAAVIANSPYSAGKIRQIYGIEPVVLNFAVPDEEDPPPPPRQGPRRLFTVSRLTRMKNLDTVLAAFRRVADEVPDVELRIAGKGDEEERLRHLAHRLGLAGRVRFLGGLSGPELSQEYALAEAVIFLPLGEPLGLVPLEAARRGLPVVASNHGGPAFTVVHEETGLLVDPCDAEQVARALVRLLQDPALARAMGERARLRVRREFSMEGYLAALEDLLARHAGAPAARV